MSSEKHTVLILMAGPKFDLEWEFGVRLEGMSRFSRGYLITSSSAARSFRIGEYEVLATWNRLDGFAKSLRTKLAYVSQCLRTMRHAKRMGQPVELVMTYDPLLTGAIGWILASLCGAKLICEVNGEYTADANFMHIKSPQMRAFKRWTAGWLTRFVLGRASGIRTLFSTQLRNIRYRPKPSQIVMQIPEFVDTAAFANLGEEPSVLLVGFPYYVKGVDIAIAAFKKVAPQFPDWTLKIIGHYPDSNRLHEAVSDSPAVSFHKPVFHREMNEHIGRCGILLQSSRTEAMGRALVEAMAAEKPRIASDVGGIPTVVADGKDGILVNSEDVEGLARALTRLMGSPELRRKMGESGASRAASEFTADKYFDNVERFFASVAGS